MFTDKELKTVLYALSYLQANYDDAVLDEMESGGLFETQENTPLTPEQIEGLRERLANAEPKLYQVQVFGEMTSHEGEAEHTSELVWRSPEEALAYANDFIDEVCDPEIYIKSLKRETVKLRVIELDLE